MKKKALWKDFAMEVKNSLNRYLSILIIVALGVAFFSGIRASEPDMQISADRYYDDTALMDIRVISTLGLSEDDITAVMAVEGVSTAEAVKTLDVLCNTKDSENVVKIISRTDSLNKIKLVDGRLPETSEECLMDSAFMEYTGYKIGDTVTFRSGNDKKLSESLKGDTYTIVGIGDSPLYLAYDRGNTSIGNGSIDFFAILSPEEFKAEEYTELYASVQGAASLTTYTKEYEDSVEKVLNRIEDIADARCEIRYEEVLKEPRQEIEDAKAELTDAKVEADDKLGDAEHKLLDGEEKITEGEKEIAEGFNKLRDGKIEIENNRTKLLDSKAALEKGEKELENAKKDIKAGEATLKVKRAEYNTGAKALKDGLAEWTTSNQQYKQGLKELQSKETELNASMQQVQEQKTALEPVKDIYPEEWKELVNNETALMVGLNAITEQKAALEPVKEQLTSAKQVLDQQKLNIEKADKLLTAEEQKLDTAKDTITEKEIQLKNGKEQIIKGQQELDKAEKEINDGEATLTEKEKELQDAKEELEKGRKDYTEAKEKAETEIADAEKKIKEGEEELNDLDFPEWYVLDRNSLQTYVEYGQDSERIGNIGKVFPVIFFLVAALVSLTTMTRMVEEQRTQIGTLKALGYSRKSIAGKYILYALTASLMGSLLGVLVGQQILPQVVIIAYKIMYHTLPEAITPYNMYYGVMSTVVAVACTTLATFFSCYKELAANPAKLMRPAAPKLGKRVILEKLPFIWSKLNFTSKAAVRNLLRYKKRFFMTVFGIGSCMALLLVGFGIKDSIGAISDIQYVNIWHQDAFMSIDEDMSGEEKDNLLKELKTDERIAETLLVRDTTVDAGYGKNVKSSYLIVPENDKMIEDYVVFRNRLTHESYTLKDDGIIITEKLASLLKTETGDTIYLEDSNKKRVEVTITAVMENYMFHYIFISPNLYEKLYGNVPEYNKVYIKSEKGITLDEKQFAEEMLNNSSITNVTFTSDFQQRITDMLNSLNMVIYVLIISAGLLAFIVLYNLNNININERKRELATLKVLGFMDGEVGAYVYRENIMLTVIGAVAGIFLGIVLHRFVIVTAEIDSIMFGRNMKLISYVLSIVLTFGFSAFVNFVMYYKLQKINMVESLKSIE
jgi:putative ABC transport system permease protein